MLRFLPLGLLAFLPACSASEALSDSSRPSDDRETVASAQAALTVDLTPTGASVIDQRNTVDGEWSIDNLVDGNLSTKSFFHHQDNWIRYQLPGAAVVTRYEISRSADDYPDRVPTAWTLEASNDGLAWTELDRRDNETLGAPSSYTISNTTPFVYYRLYVRDNHTTANGDTELAEFRIFGEAPTGALPGIVSSVTASVNSDAITVSWSAASNAGSYIVQRVGDDGKSVIEIPTSGLSYTDTKLAPGTTYVYQIQAVNGGRRGPSSTARAVATTAFAARGLKDLTALSAVAPTDEHATTTGPESVAMLTDNNPYTKWYQGDGSTWVQQQAPAGSVVTEYTLTSANDYPERDPSSWILEASNDGTNWTQIDSRANQGFLARHQTRIFTCNPNKTAYAQYRLSITSTRSSDTQLAEWRLLGTASATLAAPAAPSSLALNTFSYHQDPDDDTSPLVTGNVLTSNQIGFKFADNAGKLNPEASYVLERSTSSSFSSVVSKTVGPNSTAARAIGLSPNTTYWFRIKAVNAAGSSAYSAPLSVTTPAQNAPPNPWQEGGWYGHKSRSLILSDVDDTAKVRVWFDNLVPNPTSIKWLTPVMAAVWKRVTDNYGSLSDPYLNVVGNADGPGYGGGGAGNLYDPRTGFRNVPWVAVSGWSSIDWNDWDNVWKVHAITHETAHIVEGVSVATGYAGAPSVWEDSWWAWIFQYDMYKNLPSVFPNVFSRWRDEGLVGRGDYGWYWARDWLI
ncbi:MAG TPA: fibronectin type III domain-containing protein, partial [Polyangiaceae bacterium]|nr:fibronectin type III domain-containing protein [Polyangiaceae bacterium]